MGGTGLQNRVEGAPSHPPSVNHFVLLSCRLGSVDTIEPLLVLLCIVHTLTVNVGVCNCIGYEFKTMWQKNIHNNR